MSNWRVLLCFCSLFSLGNLLDLCIHFLRLSAFHILLSDLHQYHSPVLDFRHQCSTRSGYSTIVSRLILHAHRAIVRILYHTTTLSYHDCLSLSGNVSFAIDLINYVLRTVVQVATGPPHNFKPEVGNFRGPPVGLEPRTRKSEVTFEPYSIAKQCAQEQYLYE